MKATAVQRAVLEVPLLQSDTSGGDPEKIKTFKCDHPFLIVIRDDHTGAILILGKVVRPMIV